MKWLIAPALFLCVACGGVPAQLTPDAVEAALTQAGASAFQRGRIDPEKPVPQSYTDHADFMVAGHRGQYFLCDTKLHCDAIAKYFQALIALAGPYTYQSASGRVVVQLNSGLTPDQARPIEQAMTGL